MDEHVVEALGKSKVTIRGGKVVKVEEPIIDYCPLFDKHRGIKKLTPESIGENIQFRIDDFGMCTPNRELRLKDFLSFGVSELLSTLLDEDVIDCAVMVCEGCGTVLVCESELAQGVGGRVSGLVSTTPIPEIIEQFSPDHILDSENVTIDPIAGAKLAIDNGFKNIAVTIVSVDDGIILRELEKEFDDVNFYLFAVHTTGVTENETELLFDTCDIITSCASKPIREIGKKRNSFSVGTSIPMFAGSDIGEKFIKMRLDKIGGIKKKTGNSRDPEPLI